ncbi:pectinesterase inhibitor-like [Macadamia integrifolia]|uniref:pectinesterase inhibitor-like n=1 Tax=Macadamia integrifolia TaxID=60698 RepID=UPI001C4FDC79|nr:pectinesterase inhibitor-like [Macadamia integrifolia]
MASVSSFFFLLPLVLSLNLHLNPSEARAVNLIARTCNHSVFRNLCISTLRSDPNSAKTNLTGLASISIRQTMASAVNISSQITNLLNTTMDDPNIQQCLSDCSQSYIDAIDQLIDSVASLDNKSYSDVNKALSAAMDDALLCQEGFSVDATNPSLLRDSTNKFTQLCSNALSITNLLAGSAT